MSSEREIDAAVVSQLAGIVLKLSFSIIIYYYQARH